MLNLLKDKKKLMIRDMYLRGLRFQICTFNFSDAHPEVVEKKTEPSTSKMSVSSESALETSKPAEISFKAPQRPVEQAQKRSAMTTDAEPVQRRSSNTGTVSEDTVEPMEPQQSVAELKKTSEEKKALISAKADSGTLDARMPKSSHAVKSGKSGGLDALMTPKALSHKTVGATKTAAAGGLDKLMTPKALSHKTVGATKTAAAGGLDKLMTPKALSHKTVGATKTAAAGGLDKLMTPKALSHKTVGATKTAAAGDLDKLTTPKPLNNRIKVRK